MTGNMGNIWEIKCFIFYHVNNEIHCIRLDLHDKEHKPHSEELEFLQNLIKSNLRNFNQFFLTNKLYGKQPYLKSYFLPT